MTPIAGSLTPFLDPVSVAVIGASRDPFKVGGAVVANLRSAGFPGRIIPINSRASTVQGLAAAPRLADVEGRVDLAVIAVPAVDVLPALGQCVTKGVGGAVVISAGFRELGGEGARREARLREWLRGQPIRVLGPNCLGWIRPARRLNVTFAPGMPEPGGIAFVSHSGAVAVAILDWARDRRVGFSLFASLGNQADVNESDLLDAAARDEETRVIAGYIEGVADGPRFLDALRRAAATKPVVLLKAGRSPEGTRAVFSHTGALAGSDRAFDAAVQQAGALRVDTVAELFDTARGLASQPLPRGRRLVVVTNGGGLGIVATDAARTAGFTMEPPPEPLRRRLAEGLPAMAGLGNPVDLVGDADARRYGHALHTLGTDGADAMLVLLTPQATTDAASVARTIAAATQGWSIPVVAAFVGGARVAPGVRTLEEAHIPCYAFPEPAVKTLAGMARLGEYRRTGAGRFVPSIEPTAARAWLAERATAPTPRLLAMAELRPLLAAYGVVCLDGGAATAPAGQELLLGGVRDGQWGSVLMVGLGGLYVEVLGDTTVRLAPVSPDEAAALLDELRIAPLLRAPRGGVAVDRAALAGVISRFSQLLVDLPELAEIEINPLRATPDGAVALDARARLGGG
jgi:acetyl coenzyme A synthetase (ADP forming)-like protein